MSDLPRGRNSDYWAGFYASAASRVATSLRRDNARKQVILRRNPWAFTGMDAQELGEASATELALRELKALGIVPPFDDPIKLLSAVHASPVLQQGIRHAAHLLGREAQAASGRDRIPFQERMIGGENVRNLIGEGPGGKTIPLVGSGGTGTQEAQDADGTSFLDRYLKDKE